MDKSTQGNSSKTGLGMLLLSSAAAFLAGFGAGHITLRSPPAEAATAEARLGASPGAVLAQPVAQRAKPAPRVPAVTPPAIPQIRQVTMQTLSGITGIKISSVGLALDGAALNVRYTVLDPEKATLLSDDTVPVFLVHETTGAQMFLKATTPMGAVSAHSRARSVMLAAQQSWSFPLPRNKLVAGQEYSIMLNNPQKVVQSGAKLAFAVGDYRVHEITVE